ncbi:THAP domain-containing protein 2-like [Anneissia japonica]|uniref:THAP domain-containing protein 2-like n=1 Tax=Anneissia japonica TaxID=1529436 RepID=UPI0014256ECC|nr:THAP domain-containing protein 2-like [Anneissia japonica]
MPGNCEAVGCTNHTLMLENKPSFHRFPKDSERRKKWTNALKKLNRDGTEWTPSSTARICGEHFINGKPNHNDPTHPDYVPSVFKHTLSTVNKQKKMSRYNSAVKRRRLCYPPTNNSCFLYTSRCV